jgi:hypothetical protein
MNPRTALVASGAPSDPELPLDADVVGRGAGVGADDEHAARVESAITAVITFLTPPPL